MKAIVVYGSAYGNTEKIARAIAEALHCNALLASEVNRSMLEDIELLVVGSPTQGGRPLPEVQSFVATLPDARNVRFAAFDTRFDIQEQNFGLRLLMKTIGYAAPKIAKILQTKHLHEQAEPEGFIVNDKEGPLRKGELDRASKWAARLAT